MGAVGLFYVGAVLFVNGLMLLGLVNARSAAPLNLFVGALQVVTPTVLIILARDDPQLILAASGIYLFGFTYLYVGINLLVGLDSTGVGYFSLFVAAAAIGYSIVSFTNLDDPTFGVIWLYWAFLWFLFFLVLGLKIDRLTRYTGAVTTVEGIVTAALPALLILTGNWDAENHTEIAWGLAVLGVLMAVVFLPLARQRPEPATADGPPGVDVPSARRDEAPSSPERR